MQKLYNYYFSLTNYRHTMLIYWWMTKKVLKYLKYYSNFTFKSIGWLFDLLSLHAAASSRLVGSSTFLISISITGLGASANSSVLNGSFLIKVHLVVVVFCKYSFRFEVLFETTSVSLSFESFASLFWVSLTLLKKQNNLSTELICY